MENVESVSDRTDAVQRQKFSEISDFVNAEQNDVSKPATVPGGADPLPPLADDERNVEDELSSASVDESGEPSYQDILGSGDLLKKIVKPGSADDRPMKGEQIMINLVGRLEDDGGVIEEEENLEITLGDCEVMYA